jgi:hypothetical protein
MVRVAFADISDYDNTHKSQWFLLNKQKTEISYYMRMLFHALFDGDAQVRDDFLALTTKDTGHWQLLRGMRVQINIQPTAGHAVDFVGSGYVALNALTNEKLSSICNTVEQARAAAQARGFGRSFNNVKEIFSVGTDDNVEALRNAVEGLKGAASPEGHSPVTNIRPGT